MYSTISIKKLSELTRTSEDDILKRLIQIKVNSQQFVKTSQDKVSLKESSTSQNSDSKYKVVSDVHFYIKNDTVYVDDKQKKQKFADFFLQNALRLGQCSLDLEASVGKVQPKPPRTRK